MMGQQAVAQEQLFYSFNLDAHIPPDHLLRRIEHFLDFGGLRQHLAKFYSHTGRPSIDPGADDADADHWLLLRHPLGTPAVR